MTTSTTSPGTTRDLARLRDELAWAIERDGIERHERTVARLAVLLRSAGAGGALLDLVADQAEPSVARERAFGRLSLRTPIHGTRDPRLVAA